MNQVKIIYGNARNNSSVAMHLNENVVTATKPPSPAVLEVIILTTSSAASDENLRNCRFCAWAMWKHGHVDHPMSLLADEFVIATTLATEANNGVNNVKRSCYNQNLISVCTR